MKERPEAIIKTMPLVAIWQEQNPRDFLRSLKAVDRGDTFWLAPLPAVPKHEVLYFYFLIQGRLRYRLNISHYEPGGERTFEDGRKWTAKTWAILTGPVVKPPHKIEMRGFQAFRDSTWLF
jgi:hypothetical protein